jgi:hypothetical protein
MVRFSNLMRVSGVAINLLIYSLAWILFLLNKPVGVPDYWKIQFLIILIASCFLAILVRVFEINWLILTGIILRTLLALIAINSMPEQMPVFAPLIAVILFEIFLSASTWPGIVSSLFLIFLMTYERYLTNQTWGYFHQTPRISDFLLPWGECVIAVIPIYLVLAHSSLTELLVL